MGMRSGFSGWRDAADAGAIGLTLGLQCGRPIRSGSRGRSFALSTTARVSLMPRISFRRENSMVGLGGRPASLADPPGLRV